MSSDAFRKRKYSFYAEGESDREGNRGLAALGLILLANKPQPYDPYPIRLDTLDFPAVIIIIT